MTAPLTIDNRDKDEMIAVLEARVEALIRRVKELEAQAELPTLLETEFAVPC